MRQRPKPPARPERVSKPPHRAAVLGKTRGAPERRTRTGRERWMSAKLENGTFDAGRLLRFPEWAALAPLLEPLGISPQDALPRLAAYAALILTWNRSVSNLISQADESRIVSRHLLESLQPAKWLAESGAESWLDFGSGAGLPALPLVVAGVGKKWSLVESRRPKALFLRRAVQDLRLKGVTPIHARLEQLRPPGTIESDRSESNNAPFDHLFDAFTSRATMRLEPTLQIASMFVRPGGVAFLWKGSRLQSELSAHAESPGGWVFVEEMPLSVTGASVCKLVFVK